MMMKAMKVKGQVISEVRVDEVKFIVGFVYYQVKEKILCSLEENLSHLNQSIKR